MFASKDALISGSGVAGYTINNSLRFRSSASAYLNRTNSATTNRTTWTYSAWVKRGTFSTYQALFAYRSAAGTYSEFWFDPNNNLHWDDYNASTIQTSLITSAVYRDPSSWYHIVLVYDSTNPTAANRAKLYVNGVQVTTFGTATYPAQNTQSIWNIPSVNSALGAELYTPAYYFDGYMAEVNFIDGQALTPSSFGAYSSNGVWQPALYTGTYGTNGFYLKFASTGSTAALGNDSSGNGNTWTVNNISVTAGTTYDPMLDSPTLTSETVCNYPVLSPIDNSFATITNGNLLYTSTTGTVSIVNSTFGMLGGKWYAEFTPTGSAQDMIGICDLSVPVTSRGWNTANGYFYWGLNGQKYTNNSGTSYGASYGVGNVIGVAVDMTAGTVTFYKDNVSQGVAFTGLSTTKTWAFAYSSATSTAGVSGYANFGQRAFTYTPPTGFVALNAYNLLTPTIANGATVMAATTYAGNSSTNNVLNSNNSTNNVVFKPDFVWIKNRTTTLAHYLSNTVTGPYQVLFSNLTNAEFNGTATSDGVSTFNTNGFTLLNGSNVGNYNQSANNYIAWQWQAGQGVSSSNTNGSITSTVSVNATAGFSVVTYTGNNIAGATVGHGLGVAPSMMILKPRSNGTDGWAVYHTSIGNGGALYLESTAATISSGIFWNSTNPTSSVFSIGTANRTNGSGYSMLAYCWSAVAGYSAFGSYTGNGSTDGPFIYLGLRARFIMIKRTDTTGDWCMIDTSRDTYNIASGFLYSNLSVAEQVNGAFDFLSNGIKMRNTFANLNASGGTYVYAAFAENPFKYALAR